MTSPKTTPPEKNPDQKKKKAASSQKETSLFEGSLNKIKAGFTEGLSEGRTSFLKKLLKVKGVNTHDVQQLYSSGLMEPDILKDISLGDLVKSAGIKIEMARSIKELIKQGDSDLPFEYHKQEVEKIKKETAEYRKQIEQVKKERETLEKEYHLTTKNYTGELNKKETLDSKLATHKLEEQNAYIQEKRVQNEVLFLIDEHTLVKKEIQSSRKDLGLSKKRYDAAQREFIFTKGECSHIIEKINYLVGKLETVVKIKNISHDKLESFLTELRCIHDTLMDSYKRTSVDYYNNNC